MGLKIKKVAKAGGKRSIALGSGTLVTESSHPKLERSKTVVPFDCPIDILVEHSENPNEQNEKTFDELVERIRTEGVDEPIMVYPELKRGQPTGRFVIFSGHHRKKAAQAAGLTTVPIIIREGWDEDRAAVELIARNQLHGNLNPHKFSKLYMRLEKRYSPEQLKRMMGFTEKKAFEQVFKNIRDQLPAKAKKKLDEAKETVKSVEDLSSVLHDIFEKHGSELDHSLLTFSFGGKTHYYFEVDNVTDKMLKEFVAKLSDDAPMMAGAVFKRLMADPNFDNVIEQTRKTINGDKGKASASTSKRKLVKPAPKQK